MPAAGRSRTGPAPVHRAARRGEGGEFIYARTEPNIVQQYGRDDGLITSKDIIRYGKKYENDDVSDGIPCHDVTFVGAGQPEIYGWPPRGDPRSGREFSWPASRLGGLLGRQGARCAPFGTGALSGGRRRLRGRLAHNYISPDP